MFIVKLDTNKSVKGFTSIVSDVSDPSGIPVVANDEFGSSVALIGDVDGDGISDLVCLFNLFFFFFFLPEI